MDKTLENIGKIWSARRLEEDTRQVARTNWMQSSTVTEYLSTLVCGHPCAHFSDAICHLMKEKLTTPFRRAISVGCGVGDKEMRLIKNGIVDHFDLYEIAHVNVERGRKLARDEGLDSRMTFFSGRRFPERP